MTTQEGLRKDTLKHAEWVGVGGGGGAKCIALRHLTRNTRARVVIP